MLEEAPNVVTEDGLRGLLAQGYQLEVVCKETGAKRHNSWFGIWTVRALGPDTPSGRDEKFLVTSRSYVKAREFKTIVGLVSFLYEMGMRVAHIPLEQGERVTHSQTKQG